VSAELLVQRDDLAVYHAGWDALLATLPRREDGTVCDALIVDAPYSERTHSGHDGGTAQASKVWLRSDGTFDVPAERRPINYGRWADGDVESFVAAWGPTTRGWMVSITDDVLAHTWQRAMADAGRYAFAPLPFVAPGSRVRLTGDGPSNWSCWVVVSRPRTREMQRWGTLPGAYVLPSGHAERMPVVGGKPTWLMERLVEDYSRPGDLVCDPCCGAGTALLAALRTGRRAVGGDAMREHAELAADRCGRRMIQRPLLLEAP
jgi:hypothetical protein